MPYGLYISAEGAQVQARRLDVIANNIANSDTVGFKRDLAVMQSRYAEAAESGLVSPGMSPQSDIGGGVQFHQTVTDFSPGPVRATGNSTDVALQGDGFFVVRKGQEKMLTRAGNFRLKPTGELVTQQGYSVLAEDGSPIAITPGGGAWSIDSSGSVNQDGTQQPLGIVRPDSLDKLSKVGETLFRASGNLRPVAPADRAVASGSLEMSAVQPTSEMTNLIEASRLLEANVNLLKQHNEMLSNLVDRILKA